MFSIKKSELSLLLGVFKFPLLRGDQGEWRLKLFTLTFFSIPHFPSPSFPPSKGEATQQFIFYKKSEIFPSSWGIEVSPLERGLRGVAFLMFSIKKSEIFPSSWGNKFPLLRGDQGEWRLKLFTLTFFSIPHFPSPSFPPSKGEATKHLIFYKKVKFSLLLGVLSSPYSDTSINSLHSISTHRLSSRPLDLSTGSRTARPR
jgi:hypothetical protein